MSESGKPTVSRETIYRRALEEIAAYKVSGCGDRDDWMFAHDSVVAIAMAAIESDESQLAGPGPVTREDLASALHACVDRLNQIDNAPCKSADAAEELLDRMKAER